MPSYGQVRRALEWEAFRSIPRLKRGKAAPTCVTCGAEPSHEFAKGEPAYDCQHEPFRIDAATLERGREYFGGQKRPGFEIDVQPARRPRGRRTLDRSG